MKKITLLVLAAAIAQNLTFSQTISDKTDGFDNLFITHYSKDQNVTQLLAGSVDDFGTFNVIRTSAEYSQVSTEGAMDDEGNWYSLVTEMKEGLAGRILPGDQMDGIAFFQIAKTDKNTGSVVRTFSSNPAIEPCSGLAYNPVDGLVYFLSTERPLLSKGINGSLAKPERVLNSLLYSLNTATGAITFIRTLESEFMGLACSDDGTFYSFKLGAGSFSLARFTKNTFSTFENLVTPDFNPEKYVDMEIDRSTGRCFTMLFNDALEKFEFREINLMAGTTTLLKTFSEKKDIWGGMAFEKKSTLPPAFNNKYFVTYPNGGEEFRSGTYQNITWRRQGVIQGSVQLEYSTDNGLKWKKINMAPIAGIVKYPWLVPNEASNKCLIRITNYLTHAEFDRSNSTFSISGGLHNEKAVNYPNPFNPSTKIAFSASKSSFVTLRIYNSIGQQVAELVNRQLEPGNHEFMFNAADLPSGVYMYKLEIDGVSQMQKMILMK